MGAYSVTGVGVGSSQDHPNNTLNIAVAGYLTAVTTLNTSPSTNGGTVRFPYPLQNSPNEYTVILTSLNGGAAYVSSLDEIDDRFIGFSVITSYPCQVMYIVVKNGFKPI